MQFPIKLQENQNAYLSQQAQKEVNHQRKTIEEQKRDCCEKKQEGGQLKRSFKWTCEQHAKYIYFLEMNKEKVKSKLVRKSNVFFKEMEVYLKTKTSIQCRSHHQKFEEKYRFPHRIISGQKKHIPKQIYLQTAQQVQIQHSFNKSNHQPINERKPDIGHLKQDKKGVEVSCQTQVCDLRLQYVLLGQESERNSQRGRSGYYQYMNGFGMFGQPFMFLY